MNTKQNLEFKDNDLLPLLFGEYNSHLKHLEKKLQVQISDRGNTLAIVGDSEAVQTARTILEKLWRKLEKGHEIGTAEIDSELRFMSNKVSQDGKAPMTHSDIVIKTQKKKIAARSPNQAAYIQSILDNELVFGMGPAGTGKTYLAVAIGVSMFLEGSVERLIFCRPAVEAGENLGFLPGDLKEKVDPYLRPIYDAMHDMLPADFMTKKMADGYIEVAPLAFMRGRTLSNAFVILDEAQNTTCTQMKMLLTRLGESSRMVITGDLSQTDLPIGVKSGLRDASEILQDVPGISFMHFKKEDVIRHPLVSKIVEAYDKNKP